AGDAQRIAVGFRPRHLLGADHAAGADLVLDVELLAEGVAQGIRIEPAERVGRAARGKRHHDAYRPFRPLVGGSGDAGEAQHDAGQSAKKAHTIHHPAKSSPSAPISYDIRPTKTIKM